MSYIVDLYYGTKTSLRDSVKTLRANIQFASLDKEIKTVALTSVIPSEGKTTLSCFLGISIAESGKKTVIVECDYRHPMVAKNFDVDGERTKPDKNSDKKIDAALKKTSVDNLWVLDMKCKITNPVELICSEAYANMVEKLKQDFDFVIFDTPPLGAFIDAAHISTLADGTVLVIRQGQVERRAAKDVIEQLKKANANILGAVINNVKVKKVGYYYNYYHYYTSRYYSQRDNRKKTLGSFLFGGSSSSRGSSKHSHHSSGHSHNSSSSHSHSSSGHTHSSSGHSHSSDGSGHHHHHSHHSDN